jgi:hypothetical protein
MDRREDRAYGWMNESLQEVNQQNRKCHWKKMVKDTELVNSVSPRSVVNGLRRIC